MNEHHADIVIFGAGIAGLWLHYRLRKAGYNSLLLEKNAIGSGQTIASQGIIHSGLKYAFGGKINALAKSISAMPDLWRAALAGRGDVDLSAARTNADSQYLMVPNGLMAGLVKLVTKQALGNAVHDVPEKEWPENIKASGFKGAMIFMDEPVLDVPSVLRALAAPFEDSIRKIDHFLFDGNSVSVGEDKIFAKLFIFTAAESNARIAAELGHDTGLETQARPLVQGMMKNAPYPLYAHCVGASDKPAVTITTHKANDGSLVWYLGGSVAERKFDSSAQDVFKAAQDAFAKYLPNVDLSQAEWATLPINRIEGRSTTHGWMPDTPTIHTFGKVLYAWPTKLTFAPLLSDMILEKLASMDFSRTPTDWSFLPQAPYATTPWDSAQWSSNLKSARSAAQA